VMRDIIPQSEHSPEGQARAIAGGWDTLKGCRKPPYPCVSHAVPAGIPNLAKLADRFTVSDASFAAGDVASFVAHVALGAGTFNGFYGSNPLARGSAPQWGWGCPSHEDVLWGTAGNWSLQPSCIPDPEGNGPYRESQVQYTPTIFERLEQAGLSWHTYEGPTTKNQPHESIWSVCSYFAWCYDNRWTTEWNSGLDGFKTAAANGTLPNLSVLIPRGGVSQHNHTSMRKGDNYIGNVVRSVMEGPDWDSTAIFITYDDCGCFYDHVTPPNGLGLRDPMVIVSPWVKPAHTDSTIAVQPYSMLAFVQHTFDLAPLSSDVDNAYDYGDSFDFDQEPTPAVRMTTSPISRHVLELAHKFAHQVANDPA
jgi:phospholipase C